MYKQTPRTIETKAEINLLLVEAIAKLNADPRLSTEKIGKFRDIINEISYKINDLNDYSI
jgi:hypothetical protein